MKPMEAMPKTKPEYAFKNALITLMVTSQPDTASDIALSVGTDIQELISVFRTAHHLGSRIILHGCVSYSVPELNFSMDKRSTTLAYMSALTPPGPQIKTNNASVNAPTPVKPHSAMTLSATIQPEIALNNVPYLSMDILLIKFV